MDKVISEFKVVETDDGFRIEIKGDKEEIQRMLSGSCLDSFSKAEVQSSVGLRVCCGPGCCGRGNRCAPWKEAEGDTKVCNARPAKKGYVLAAAVGAIAGGLLVALSTKAIPKMMSQMMSGMMQNMMGRMRKESCAPEEI